MAINRTKNGKTKITVLPYLIFLTTIFLSLSSCSLFNTKVTTSIPEDVLSLNEYTPIQKDLVTTTNFNVTKVSKQISNQINEQNNILVLPTYYLDTNLSDTIGSYLRIDRSFFFTSSTYVGVNQFFKNTSNKLNLTYDIQAKNVNDIYYQNYSILNIYNKFLEDDKINLLVPYLTYEALSSFLEQNPSFDLSKYDSNSDSLIDSFFFMPFINIFSKSSYPTKLKELLSSQTHLYTKEEAKNTKQELESYLNKQYSFTLSTYSFSSYYYLTEVNDLYKADNYDAYNHQFIYEIAKQFHMLDLLGIDNKNPIGVNYLSSGLVGDIDPFNKLLLNLIQPTIIDKKGKIKLEKDINKIYLIPSNLSNNSNKNINSLYNEYLLITYYDGIKNKNTYKDTSQYSFYQLNKKAGFLVFSIDNRLQYIANNSVKIVDTTTDTYQDSINYLSITNQKVTTKNYLCHMLATNDKESIISKGNIQDANFFTNKTSLFVNTYLDFSFSNKQDYKLYFEETNNDQTYLYIA